MRRLPDLGPRGEGWVILQLLLFAALALAGLFDPLAVEPVPAVVTIVGLLTMAGGVLLAGLGLFGLGRNLTPMPHPRDDAELVVSGIYARVRHPIYGGLMVLALGWGVVSGSPLTLALAAGLALFFGLKSVREEAWLKERYPGYEDYIARTKRFVPYLV